MHNENKRKFARIPLAKKVKLRFKGKEHFSKHYIKDISLGGLFLKTKQELPVGTVFHFEFVVDDELPPIKGEGTVVRISRDESGNIDGLGIKFLSLNAESLETLTKVINP